MLVRRKSKESKKWIVLSPMGAMFDLQSIHLRPDHCHNVLLTHYIPVYILDWPFFKKQRIFLLKNHYLCIPSLSIYAWFNKINKGQYL